MSAMRDITRDFAPGALGFPSRFYGHLDKAGNLINFNASADEMLTIDEAR